MTGFESKRQAAQNKMNDAADTLSIVYQRGFADGKKAAQPEQEPVAYDKTELNRFVQDLYDEKMQKGKHGHYETMFYVVHQAIKRQSKKVAPQRPWQGLTEEEIQAIWDVAAGAIPGWARHIAYARATEAKLKEKNV